MSRKVKVVAMKDNYVAHGKSNRSRQSTKRQKEDSKKRVNQIMIYIFLILGLLFLAAWLGLLIFGFTSFKSKNNYAELIFQISYGSGGLSTTCFTVLRFLYGKDEIQNKLKTRTDFRWLRGIAIFLFLVCVVLSMVGYRLSSVHDPQNTSRIGSGGGTASPNTEMLPIPYDFSGVEKESVDFDIYFSNESVQKTLENNIEDSLRGIKKLDVIPNAEELNITDGYGDVSQAVREHEDLLNELMCAGKKYILEGPVAKTTSQYIVDGRLKMDSVCQTPSNRKTLIDTFLINAKFSNNPETDYEKAVTFAWARIYTEIQWGEFSLLSIDKLMETYEYLRNNTSDASKKGQILLIEKSLNLLKVRLEQNPIQQ